MVRSAAPKTGGAFLDALLASARAISGKSAFEDDVCLVTIEFGATGSERRTQTLPGVPT
jgi:hypothetical protein